MHTSKDNDEIIEAGLPAFLAESKDGTSAIISNSKLNMKEWYKSKLIWIAIIQGALGIAMVFESQYPGVGAVVIVKSALDILLRFATTTAVK